MFEAAEWIKDQRKRQVKPSAIDLNGALYGYVGKRLETLPKRHKHFVCGLSIIIKLAEASLWIILIPQNQEVMIQLPSTKRNLLRLTSHTLLP